MITAAQMKAARALLGWSDVKLAHEAGLDPSTIINFELGTRSPSVTSMLTIEDTLKAAGVEFPRHEPVRLKRRK
jgi:transcriptional regulator with XRE-family HTH domain